MSKLNPCEHTAAKIQLLWNQLAFTSILSPREYFQSHQKYFEILLVSRDKLEPFEHNAAKIQLLWNQLAFPSIISPREYFQSHIQPHESTLKETLTKNEYFHR